MSTRLDRMRFNLIIVAIGALIAGGIVNSAFDVILKEAMGEKWPINVGILVLFLALAALWFFSDLALRNVGRILGSTARMTPVDKSAAKPFLIMGFSLPYSDKLVTKEDTINAAMAELSDPEIGLQTVWLPTDEYKLAYAKLGKTPPRNNWQQNIRAIKPRLAALKRVLVLMPNDDKALWESFAAYLNEAYGSWFKKEGRTLRIEHVTYSGTSDTPFYVLTRLGDPEKPNYEDYEYVYNGLQRGVDMLAKEPTDASPAAPFSQARKVVEQDVCIDTTSGTKTFSIAAAIATLNSRVLFSYVTNEGHPKFYDARVEITP
jgi:hypothetical protein